MGISGRSLGILTSRRRVLRSRERRLRLRVQTPARGRPGRRVGPGMEAGSQVTGGGRSGYREATRGVSTVTIARFAGTPVADPTSALRWHHDRLG